MLMAIIGSVVIGLLGLWTLSGYLSTRGIETLRYTVLQKADGYEVREYPGHVVAEITLPGGFHETMYAGFRKVADYIFGNNSPEQKIAMTAPVIHEKSETIPMTAPVLHEPAPSSGAYTLSFVMPSSYAMNALPKPNNPDVRLREVQKTRMAVLAFSGYASERRTANKTAQLQDSLRRAGVHSVGGPVLAQYDPPWTPPYMRHNEIQIQIE